MPPKINRDINVLTPAAEEQITDFELVMAKIDNDAHKDYHGAKNSKSEKKGRKKQDKRGAES